MVQLSFTSTNLPLPLNAEVRGEVLSLSFREGDVVLYPVMDRGLIYLGTDKPLQPEVVGRVLSLLRRDIPSLLVLRRFLLRKVPANSGKVFDVQVRLGESYAQWHVKSERRRDLSYVVSLDEEGNPSCTCPDFRQRRAGTGKWCKHIASLHQKLLSLRAEYLIPLRRVEEGETIYEKLGLLAVLAEKAIDRLDYSHHREQFDAPMLGVEFEVPEIYPQEQYSLLRKVLSLLKKKGVVLSFERDGSVSGGEIKLTPFPASLQKVQETADLLRSVQKSFPDLFGGRSFAGLHVHINVWPLVQSGKLDWADIVQVGLFFEKRFDLMKMFGRAFNTYALSFREATPNERYVWLSRNNYTVEVRLGNSRHEPLQVLLGAYLLCRLLWAVAGRELFALPVYAPSPQVEETLVSLFPQEEQETIRAYIRSHLV